MENMMNQNEFNNAVRMIAQMNNLSEAAVLRLIELTSEMSGTRFASLKEYRSDESDHSESASHLVQLGFNYANMKAQERKALETIKEEGVSGLGVDGYDYNRIDLDGKPLEEFKAEVRAALPKAIEAMLEPSSKKKDTSADLWLNKSVVVNRNTWRISIVGEEVRKSVVEQGEFHKPKSKALTIAKAIIRRAANVRTDKFRRFALDNFAGRLNLQGETLDIG
jgi:hypothetical protein